MNTQQIKMKSAPVLPISCLIMGGTQLSRHYYVKGGIFFAIQVCFLLYLSDIVHTLIGLGNDSNLLIVFYVQIMPDDFVMQLHRF